MIIYNNNTDEVQKVDSVKFIGEMAIVVYPTSTREYVYHSYKIELISKTNKIPIHTFKVKCSECNTSNTYYTYYINGRTIGNYYISISQIDEWLNDILKNPFENIGATDHETLCNVCYKCKNNLYDDSFDLIEEFSSYIHVINHKLYLILDFDDNNKRVSYQLESF